MGLEQSIPYKSFLVVAKNIKNNGLTLCCECLDVYQPKKRQTSFECKDCNYAMCEKCDTKIKSEYEPQEPQENIDYEHPRDYCPFLEDFSSVSDNEN